MSWREAILRIVSIDMPLIAAASRNVAASSALYGMRT
jgi:hypothetical protein